MKFLDFGFFVLSFGLELATEFFLSEGKGAGFFLGGEVEALLKLLIKFLVTNLLEDVSVATLVDFKGSVAVWA